MHADATLTLRSKTVAAGDITRRLEIEPDDSWEPGDSLARRRSPRMRRSDHGWTVRVAAGDTDHALTDLLARVEGGADALGGLVAEGETRVDLVLFECDGPGEHSRLDAHLAAFAATFGTGLVTGGESAAGSARLRTWTIATPDVGTQINATR